MPDDGDYQRADDWEWCTVMGRALRHKEGHRPAAAKLCNGTPHEPLFRLTAPTGGGDDA